MQRYYPGLLQNIAIWLTASMAEKMANTTTAATCVLQSVIATRYHNNILYTYGKRYYRFYFIIDYIVIILFFFVRISPLHNLYHAIPSERKHVRLGECPHGGREIYIYTYGRCRTRADLTYDRVAAVSAS